ncbi:hypothetical protein, partial [Corynebacterium sanguinis]|uniref:hypothetical protein n=1 Tax=Corynebacterium sanguinis TaxID=2594913 RepID=UPI0021A2A607
MLPSNMPAKLNAPERAPEPDRSEASNRVAVFIDYENARRNAREAFLLSVPPPTRAFLIP